MESRAWNLVTKFQSRMGLSRVKKSSLLYLLAVTNDSVFKSAPLFWDTLYIHEYKF